MHRDAAHEPKTPESLTGSADEGGWDRCLFDSFDGPDFSPRGGLYYRDNFEQSAGTVEFQT